MLLSHLTNNGVRVFASSHPTSNLDLDFNVPSVILISQTPTGLNQWPQRPPLFIGKGDVIWS